MEELFYRFGKNRILQQTKSQRKKIKEYIKSRDNPHGSMYFGPVPVGTFISFNRKDNVIKINVWNDGTCISMTYDEFMMIYELIKDEKQLISKLASELV